MFAGMPQVGADDAWYLTALEAEQALMANWAFIGGSVDLFKCFDQIVRGLLYFLLLLGVFPINILTAYANYHEAAQLMYVIHGTVGQPHTHPCGIPQGCPLSMLFIAFMLRPWVLEVIKLGATPRCLADDMLVTVSGPSALHCFE